MIENGENNKIKLPSGMEVEFHLPSDFEEFSKLDDWQKTWVEMRNNSFDDWTEIEGVGRFKNLRLTEKSEINDKSYEITLSFVYDEWIK